MTSVLIQNIKNSFAKDASSDFTEMMVSLNEEFMEKYGASLFRSNRLMSGPVGTFAGEVVEAKTQRLTVKYTLEMADVYASNYTVETHAKIVDAIKDVILTAAYSEILMLKAKLETENKVLCPFIILKGVKAVDAFSFQPLIEFFTVFGEANA